MEIKNKALQDMLASAIELQKKKEEEIEKEDKVVVENLPTVSPEGNKPLELSLDTITPLTKDRIMSNLSVTPREISNGSLEALDRAKRKVGRLTTGTAAAVPLVCKGASCPFKARCVAGDTLILLSNNNYKKIRDITPLDFIYSIDSEGYLQSDIIEEKIHSGVKSIYLIETYSGMSVRVTSDHPFLTCRKDDYEKTYMSINDGLTINSTVFVIDNEDIDIIDNMGFGDLFEDKISAISYMGEEEVYDISVKNNHNFLANNIVVHNCPYFAEDLHKVGENCIMEEQLAEFWAAKYMEELNIDETSLSEVHAVSQLVEIDVMDLRMTNYLSINDQNLMMEFIASADPQGNILTNKGASVAFDLKERLSKQKIKLLETLNNTREKKAKLAIETKKTENPSNASLELLRKIERLGERLSENKSSGRSVNVIDVEVRDID